MVMVPWLTRMRSGRSAGAVAEPQNGTGVERVETSTGEAIKVGIDLDTRDVLVAEPVGEQAGGVAGAGPDLQHLRAVVQIEGLQRADEEFGRWRSGDGFLVALHVELGQRGHQQASGVHIRQVRGGIRRHASPTDTPAGPFVQVRHEVVARRGDQGVTPPVVAQHTLPDQPVDE